MVEKITMRSFPKLREFAVVRKEHSDSGSVFNPFAGEISVNWIGVEIARLSDGTRSVKDIVDAVAERFSLNEGVSEKVTLEALGRFDQYQNLQWLPQREDRENGEPEEIAGLFEDMSLLKHQERNYLTAPLNVIWDITYGCNLRCKHCLTNSGEFLHDELTTQEVFRIVDQLERMKVLRVSFVGGEPLLRRDFFDILGYCSGKNIGIDFSTNGYLFSEEVLERLGDYNIFNVQISIDGLRDTHDEFRGHKGCFDKAVDAVKLVARGGMGVLISTTVTRINLHELPAMMRYFDSLRIPMLTYKAIPFMPVGRGARNAGELTLTPQEVKGYTLMMISAREELGDSFTIENEGAYAWLQREPTNAVDVPASYRIGCGAGKNLIVISPNGLVFPCPFLHDFVAGDLRKDAMYEIWHESESFSIFRSLTKGKLHGKCGDCPYLPNQCGGGCRAAAYAKTGDLFAEDPACWFDYRGS